VGGPPFQERQEALAGIAKQVAAYRRRAEAQPDVFLPDLARSLQSGPRVVPAGASRGGLGCHRGGDHHPPAAGRGSTRRLPVRTRGFAQNPVGHLVPTGAPQGGVGSQEGGVWPRAPAAPPRSLRVRPGEGLPDQVELERMLADRGASTSLVERGSAGWPSARRGSWRKGKYACRPAPLPTTPEQLVRGGARLAAATARGPAGACRSELPAARLRRRVCHPKVRSAGPR